MKTYRLKNFSIIKSNSHINFKHRTIVILKIYESSAPSFPHLFLKLCRIATIKLVKTCFSLDYCIFTKIIIFSKNVVNCKNI